MSAWMLQADYLEFIHDALVALLWPGTEPIGQREQRDRGLIESAAARPFHTLLGEDAYPTITEKAVALFHSINANHAFMNGNKRTAVIAMDHFFTVNDHCLLLTNEAMYKIAEKTAAYKERGLSQQQSLAEITEGRGGHRHGYCAASDRSTRILLGNSAKVRPDARLD
jgi:death on curing protein